MKPAVLTVDWGYFIPEKIEWDLGHNENKFFLSEVWKTRYRLKEHMTIDPTWQTFWTQMNRAYFFDKKLYVSDSHADIVRVNELQVNDLVLVDQHHDCWQSQENHLDCGTWGRAWLKLNPQNRIHWIATKDMMFEKDSIIQDLIKSKKLVIYHELDSLPTSFDFIATHVCRSGCWTPPWFDLDFIQFVEKFGALETTLGLDWADPMKPRWIQKDYDEAEEYTRQSAEAIRIFNEQHRKDNQS